MSPIDMTQLDRMDVDPEPDAHTGRCDNACDGVEGEIAPRGSPRGEVAVALRSYGDGCVAAGIAALGGPPSNTSASHTGPDREPCLEEWGLRP